MTGATAFIVSTTVDVNGELGDLAFAMAIQAGFVAFHEVHDGRCGLCFVADQAGVVGPPLVILRNGLPILQPMARTALLPASYRVGEGRSPGHQCISRRSPAFWRMAQGAVIVANLVWSLVAVTADKVETLEVGPAMALETICIGVKTYELHRVHAKLCLLPCVTGHVAVLARHDSGKIVRADVAGVAVAEPGFQVALPVAIQTDLHGADDVSGNRIEPVSYLTVAITAQHPTCGARPNSVPDQPVGGTQIVLGELLREITVA